MRLLHVVHGYPPASIGGTENHTRQVVQSLADLGHDVWVFAARPHAPSPVGSQEIQQDGPVAVRWIDASPGDELRDPRVQAAFERLVDDLRPDAVHVQHLAGLSSDLTRVAWARSIPTVISLHDHWFLCPCVHPGPAVRHPFAGKLWGLACAWHGFARTPRRAAAVLRSGRFPRALANTVRRPSVLRRELALADVVLAPSRFLFDEAVRFGARRETLQLLPHASGVARRHGPHQICNPVRFGFVGAVVPHKGADVLCEAFRRLEGDATLAIHGPAPDPAFLRRVTRGLWPRGRYHGPFEPSEAVTVYDSFDVLVMPSTVAESFGLSALEAQARGIPVIASRIGALPERVKDEQNGLLVAPGDVRELQTAMSRLEDMEQVGRLAEGVTPPGSMSDYARYLEAVYRRVVDRRSRALVGERRDHA